MSLRLFTPLHASQGPSNDKKEWSHDLSLLQRAATQKQARASLKKKETPSQSTRGPGKRRQLEFELKEALDQRNLEQFEKAQESLAELFPSYSLSSAFRLEEAILRFEKKQYGKVLEISRAILRDQKAKELFPRALLIRAQAFRELGIETAAIGTYEVLTKKFPRSPQAKLGYLEASAIKLSIKR